MSGSTNQNLATQLEAEEWIETVVNGIALFEGVPVHVEHLADGPGQKDAPQQPELEIPAPMPGEAPPRRIRCSRRLCRRTRRQPWTQ